MIPLERHVFVCTNRRDPDNPKGCCAAKGSEEVRDLLKERVAKLGLKGRVRINAAGCLDQCAAGTTIVVYPDAVWYGRVTAADIDDIVQSHLLEGKPVERLRIDQVRRAP